jgi:hypothetical protein
MNLRPVNVAPDAIGDFCTRKDHRGFDLISDALPFGRLLGIPYVRISYTFLATN